MWAQTHCCLDAYYGDALPDSLDHLTANGLVAKEDDPTGEPEAFFFVQWFGIPDDAGGYWWSPRASPSGQDMFGMACLKPVDLGGGWWMCGM
ncbi:hypothetical protein [Nocardioides jishulii]|uniref:Uncharacterized protein n=1 Tax=Nocardioides jishulii TaxID=2575440 RepID=A0A4U2YS79_9ACTN|nr:hypothetical protein [Nocardioides jishulii]QCX28815.1 hypothetical protein FCL41_15720 [Nocardioides jishulii]TKI64288.1 hypothetical protein FC770_03845 [Nocardioides jishulii]